MQAFIQPHPGIQDQHCHRMNPAFFAKFWFELNKVLDFAFG